MIAIASTAGVYLYDADTFEVNRYLETGDEVYRIDFSSDGELLAAGTPDLIYIWNVSTGELLHTINTSEGVVALSPDGKTAASANGNTILLWDLSDGELSGTLELKNGEESQELLNDVVFGPDGKVIAATVLHSEAVWLWRVSDRKLLHVFEEPSERSRIVYGARVAFSPDGEAVSSSVAGTSRVWSVSDWELLYKMDGNDTAFSPDGKLAATSFGSEIRLWRVSDGEPMHTLIGHRGNVVDAAFSPDGSTLVSGGRDETVRLWRVSDGRLLHIVLGHTSSAGRIAFSPDGELIAATYGGLKSDDNNHRIWQVSDGRLLRVSEEGCAGAVAFSYDGTLLAVDSYYYDETLLLRVSDGELVHTLEGHTTVFSPDGKLVASVRGSIYLWDISDWTLQGILEYPYFVEEVAFSPDGERIVAVLYNEYDDNDQVWLWSVPDGELLHMQEERHTLPILSVAFSPDGEVVALGSRDETIRLLHMPDGKLLHMLDNEAEAKSIAFSPDGSLLASGSLDGTIRLWRVSDGVWLHTLERMGNISDVAFSPDGSILAACDGVVRLWSVVE